MDGLVRFNGCCFSSSVVLCVARGFHVLKSEGPLRAGGVPVKSERVAGSNAEAADR